MTDGGTGTGDTGREPFRRIQAVSSVQNDVREMQENLRELQSELRQLEWGLLGGRSMYDPAKSHKLAAVTAENLEYIADEIDELPTCVEETGKQDDGWRCPNCDRINEHDWDDCSDCDYVRDREIRTDGGTQQTDTDRGEAMKVGSRKTVRVSVVMDYTVEIDVPPNADLGEQADHELWLTGRWDDYDEKHVLNTEVLETEPLWEDDFEDSEGWPSHV